MPDDLDLPPFGERPVDLDLSLAATPSGPFLALVADKRVTLTAQAALGRTHTGDLPRARTLLGELANDALDAVVATAAVFWAEATAESKRRRDAEPTTRPATIAAAAPTGPDADTGQADTVRNDSAGSTLPAYKLPIGDLVDLPPKHVCHFVMVQGGMACACGERITATGRTR